MKFPKLLERFCKYCSFDTQSNFDSDTYPSTKKQLVFLKYLNEELNSIGLKNINLNQYGYLTASIESNIKKDNDFDPIIFIAHVDTSPEESGENVKPQVIYNYNGKDILYPDDRELILNDKIFPKLKDKIGKTIITGSGKTLLGADDKSGVAEIVTAFEYLLNHPEIEHPEIWLLFTPDEEVGNGTKFIDIKNIKAKYGYTLDGGEIGEIENENFNAINGEIIIYGFNTHPGYAKDNMINAVRAASIFISNLNLKLSPERTEGKEGFIHILDIKGDVNQVNISFIARDFDYIKLKGYISYLEDLLKNTSNIYPGFKYKIDWKESYKNMKEVIDKNPKVLDKLISSCKKLGLIPVLKGVRGGTDGARLSFLGLPCPNIFTGSYLHHSKYEFAVLEEMEKATELIIILANEYSF